jgi:hypothetical protein
MQRPQQGRPFKFPNPNDYSLNKSATFCPADRILNLYNQDNSSDAQKISNTVREWFANRATQEGWSSVHFLHEVETEHYAGCALLV